MDAALVIAGTSFVGRHLCRRLAERGITRRTTSRTSASEELVCDLTRPGEIAAIIQGVRPRWIFNCSGCTANSEPAEMHALHVVATQSLLGAVARHAPNAVTVLFGSAAEYGPLPPELLPIREDAPCNPISEYGRSKLAQVRTSECTAREHGLRVHVVRPFNLIGPGLGRQYLAASLCERLRQAKRGAILVNNGHATRDWVDVRDAVDAVVRLAVDAAPQPGALGLYNIATGEETPVLALAEHLCRLAGDFHAVDAGSADSRSAIDRSCGDATQLRLAVGWQPSVPWRRSLDDMFDSTHNLTTGFTI